MNWLLPAPTLAQLVASVPTAAQRWAHGVDARALRVSVISVAQLRTRIQLEPAPATRARLDVDLTTLLAQIEADSGIAPLAFSAEHALLWSHLCLEPTLAGLAQTERQIYATAMYEGLTVVEPARPQHAALRALGVRLHAL